MYLLCVLLAQGYICDDCDFVLFKVSDSLDSLPQNEYYILCVIMHGKADMSGRLV